MKLERAALSIATVDKSTPDKIGGWASTYENVDRYGRVMKVGAFGSTLGGKAHAGKSFDSFTVPMLSYHDDTKPTGASLMIPLPETGMKHESSYAATDWAREMAALVEAGAIPATSISWDPNSAVWAFNAQGNREFTYIDIMENSLCPCPANPLAILEAASLATTGAAPAWEKDVPAWVRDLWPDFAHATFGPQEVIDLSRAAKPDREKAAGAGQSQAVLQTAHDSLVSLGAECANDAETASWPPDFRNALPDSAFAVVVAGGTRDAAGLTVPRSLRKLAYRNAEGAIDPTHLRRALAKVEQAQLDDPHRAIAKKALVAAAAEAGIETREAATLMFSGREQAAVTGSFEELRDLLQQALQAAYPGQYPWIRATYPDNVVYELDAALSPSLGAPEPGTYRVTYVVDQTDGDVEFGTPEEVMLKDIVIPIPEDQDADDAGMASLEVEAMELEAEALAIG